MGASLLAMAVFQATLILHVPPSSRAGSLPQLISINSNTVSGLGFVQVIHACSNGLLDVGQAVDAVGKRLE
ncbi:hypothetical protein FJD35_23055 [Pseudomonas mandelii]|nr:hypothetical protein FJD35_23055 [Pseudomonas mandelii]